MTNKYKKYKPIYDEFIKLYPLTLSDLDGEIWKPVPDYEKYHVSNYGRVKRFYKHSEPRIMTPQLDGGGYLHVGFSKNGKLKQFRINRLVAICFIDNPENKPEVNHLRGRFNNYVGCLEWATSAENNRHAYDTGLKKASKAKLSAAQVLEIRENPKGLTGRELAKIYGIAPSIISQIQTGKKWKNAGGKIRDKIDPRKLNEEQREEIRARYSQGGVFQRELAAQYGVDQTAISYILRNK